jgi:hypothetical protein
MDRQEMQERLPKIANVITEEVLWQLTPIYCLLDFDKNDFCKIIESIGIEKWISENAVKRWERLATAEAELSAKEKYIKNKDKIDEMERELKYLKESVNLYEKNVRTS